ARLLPAASLYRRSAPQPWALTPPPRTPTTSPHSPLLVGDSSIRNIRFFNTITRCTYSWCYSPASLPTTDLFNLLESCGRSVFISGPLPTFFRGAERFSRLLGLNTWLQRSCSASDFYFIDNFNLFWNRPAFYHQDGLHPSTLGSSILAGNIQHTVHTSPTD
uniref:SGNH domain-containing protein n=1 Tax=Salarias fasciatus TaxID=181472 RepID=A0A672FG96_SALFA